MKYLPIEIRQLIVDHLAGPEYSFDSKGYYAGTLEHIADVKSLRLSCRAFADLAAQHLFHSVWLFMTDESFDRLRNIASTPSFAKYVRRLKIFWNLLDATSFAGEQSYLLHLEMTPRRILPRELKRRGWSAIQSLVSQHERLSPQISDLLTQTLPSFPRLSEIEPGVAWEILRHSEAMKIPTGTIQKIARETLLPGAFDGWRHDLHNGQQLHSLFRAMARSHCQGQKLVLFNCGANISSEFLDFPSEMLEVAEAVAGGLSEVRLRLETEDDDDLDVIIEKGLPPRFLGWLKRTERLCLQTSFNSYIVNLALLMPAAVVLPRLRHLALYRLTASAECLISVLDRHRETLRTISIVETTLMEGAWRDVFEKLRVEEAMRVFHFEDNYLLRGTRYPKDAININGTKMEAALNQFVFRGGGWPEEGCEDLELEAYG